MKDKHTIAEYFNGKALYGDDFDDEQISAWFETEREGYACLWGEATRGNYYLHALNIRHCYRFLPKTKHLRVLGIGSSYGDELSSIKDRVQCFTILEPSEMFENNQLFGIPVRYVKPNPLGEFPFSDESFDLVVCFSVLHHIPNVSKIISEIHRCLVNGGHALLREPILSLGDWRTPRKGLTTNERGIPPSVFRSIINSAGLKIMKENLCFFPIWGRIANMCHLKPLNSPLLTVLDNVLCSLLSWNYSYHSTKWWHKFQPTSVAYVLSKEDENSETTVAEHR